MRGDAEQLANALSALPEDTDECAAASASVAGPNVWRVEGRHESARASTFEEKAEELRAELDELSATGAQRWLDRISDLARHELVVIPDEHSAPAVDLQMHAFEAGVLRGRALLWDHEEHRWVCAARGVVAESTPDLALSYTAPVTGPDDPQALGRRLQAQLDEDFERNVMSAALATLREPPTVPSEEPSTADGTPAP